MAVTIDTPSARATVRYLHVSPYKIRQVLDLVRGLPVDDAIRVLQLCEKDAADDVLKLLDSAVANAEHNQQLPADELFVARVWCDEGPTRKSGQAACRGRYFRIRKRTRTSRSSSPATTPTSSRRRRRARGVERSRRGDRAAPPVGAGAPFAPARGGRRARARRHDHDDHDHDHDDASRPSPRPTRPRPTVP